jgi:ectoine hydroxylase-related dioxygenase (phytanoyl-CoA dioxygenase family)
MALGTAAPDDPVERAVMSPGSAIFSPGSLWHGGGTNQAGQPRLGGIVESAAGWLRQRRITASPCPAT